MNSSDWMPYSEAINALKVALSLGWIATLSYDNATVLYRVNYIGKAA